MIPRRNGAKYTPSEDVEIAMMIRLGMSNKRIAAALGRSLSSIQTRISFLGVGGPCRKRMPRQQLALRDTSQDCSSQAGAEMLARRIEVAWHAQGHPEVRAWPVRLTEDKSGLPVWGVASNLVNGGPA